MSEEPYTIRIVCDMRSHPHHKGRDAHITELQFYDQDEIDRANPWRYSERELSKSRKRRRGAQDRPLTFDFGASTGPTRRSLNYMKHELPELEGAFRDGTITAARYELECGRCGEKASARMETMNYCLNQLMQAGLHKIDLRTLGKKLDKNNALAALRGGKMLD
ncbi:hypothetical protein FYJ24_07140 [Actinomycetaceae bacterium WB03_NA08]|uniref:Uncharacterized protein n=1 Tax=Scrofimicrobium canadense TaxID=2652290 RepID=A0A6N7VU85_9ACTO|nr:hypothetical protein [Scrofimicrobium canadense]MSS84540.1 hypothetical protein [Scrofimicrobium canadense]